ncbi:SH3 domain-containing protein [Streptomyces uncialis]|uniref:SH3 domain-containing protein n=1 Tax=Streptomyces uncialis TaxID=1048205 RepID=UPI0037FB7F25
MRLRTLAIATAGTALALASTITPAAAAPTGHDGDHDRDRGHYQGRVTAHGGLLLRDSPTRGSRVIRHEPHGAIVSIYCRTEGERVDHNHIWYLLTDGTWAWGSARYIEVFDRTPHWC